MQIRETFATAIQERIEPVVKVADRSPAVLLNELRNLVVTPQWERYLHHILEAYADAFDREDEQGIGIWISGFFGSGKSLLLKILGGVLSGGELLGQSVHQLFLDRLPASSSEKADIERFLAICQRKLSTFVIGGNLGGGVGGIVSDAIGLGRAGIVVGIGLGIFVVIAVVCSVTAFLGFLVGGLAEKLFTRKA